MSVQDAERKNAPVLLDVKGLEVAYGKAQVIHGVDFQVRKGEFVALLGRNGAGKSTTLHALSGLIPKKAGVVRFKDRDISRLEPREIVREGIVNVLEGHRVFTGLTVEDNLLLGTYAKKSSGDGSKLDRIYALFPEIGERRHQLASRLSGGQQQILAVGQGIIANPHLLILDEPSGGLAPIVVDRILKVAKELCDSGIAILLVEQLVREALKFSDYCYLVETGRIGGEGTAQEVRSGELIKRIYLGG
ncbi:branched-chain amino acid transport system ATP-binding protein [Variovorax sp. Sphag1AA]|nr:branched-chain amino acid transport system ATP-binding protein [Variovorax sp. Sphag1AA]